MFGVTAFLRSQSRKQETSARPDEKPLSQRNGQITAPIRDSESLLRKKNALLKASPI